MEDSKSRYNRKSRYEQASIFGKLFISHIFPLFVRGLRNNGLSLDDVDRCPTQDQVESNAKRLLKNWNREKNLGGHFWLALVRTFGLDFIGPILLAIIEEAFLKIIQALFLAVVIRYFSHASDISDSATYRDAGYSAIGLCLCLALFNLMFYPRDVAMGRIGIRVQTSCCSLLYQKALRLNLASLDQTSVGQIANLMSIDVHRIEEFVHYLPYLIAGPIQTALATYIVWTYLGVFCIFGTGLLLLLIPVQFGIARLFSKIRSQTAKLTDTRLRLMHEIVSGMRVIKMYCWERPFAHRIGQARKAEVRKIRNASNLKAINLSIFQIASQLSLFISFVAYVLFGHNSLNAETVFVSMVLFNAIRRSMTHYFPLAIRTAAEVSISCQRIENFLMLEEFKSQQILMDTSADATEKVFEGLVSNRRDWRKHGTDRKRKKSMKPVWLRVNHICAKWNMTLSQPTLKEVSLRLEPGDLLAVIGPVGSGKSSLLMTLLGELPLDRGDISREGRLSYAGQQPWIFNDSVYNNILLGMDYSQRRYQKVVEVCALHKDLELLPFGDQTLVGEKGVQLSGGQKARIELARAVYRSADIYLMDDPLSAVDAGVADHIFEKCILGHLRNKVRVLVTHQIQFIQKATKVLVLKEGQSLAYGSYEELREQGVDFVSLLAESDDVDLEEIDTSIESSDETLNISIVNYEKPKINEEQSQHGSIQGRVFLAYIRAASSPLMFTVMVVFTVLSQSIYHASDLFLSAWTNKNELQLEDGDSASPDHQSTDILIYSALASALFVTTIIRAVSIFDLCLRTSEHLHNQIFARLLQTPLLFFETNPVGRIINRFSKDFGIVDETLVNTVFNLNRNLSQIIGLIVTICIVDWSMFLPSLVLIIVSINIRRLYIVAARDLRRFEGIARSPIFSHVGSSLSGLVSIRAYGTETSFKQQFHTLQDNHSSVYFLVLSSSSGLGQLVSLSCMLYVCTVVATVMMIPEADLPGGSAGLIISSAMGLGFFTSSAVRQSADFESQMTSVERIVEYQNLEQEAPAESEKELKPDNEWPSRGEIQFERLSLIYGNNQDKPVLKNLSFVVKAGEKIGIVGRTGAGKSSMIAALFRLTETSGVIRIDGVDIQSIGLDDLRRKISIIPQDPVIYSGTIRYNLDPFGQYADCSLWDALDHVQLRATVANLEGQLETQLNDSGNNLSVGQRQLICLARAILCRNQILVLDEATANIDHQTDSLIQQTLRSQFSACTVLTIAHRLNSIIDSDRVLVLDAGQIVEFDVPYLLLQRQTAFYEMCQKTGPKMYAHLLRTAQLAHQNPLQSSA